MSTALQSPDMPIGTPRIPWKCRQCKYEWFSRTKDENGKLVKPERCPPPNGCGSSLWERKAEKRGPKGKAKAKTARKNGKHDR